MAVLIASALVFLVAVAWLVGAVPEREAVGQTPRNPETTAPTPASPPPEAASASASPAAGLDDFLGDALGSASASARASGPRGVPDLSVMEVIGNLKYFSAGVDFRCASPTGTEGNNIEWSCVATSPDRRGSYEVTVVGNDPVTIFSVTATARGVSEEEAASFFSYVTGLCLPDAAPLNPEAWVQQNVPTGGQTFTEGTDISVYGTQEVRALEVVASPTF